MTACPQHRNDSTFSLCSLHCFICLAVETKFRKTQIWHKLYITLVSLQFSITWSCYIVALPAHDEPLLVALVWSPPNPARSIVLYLANVRQCYYLANYLLRTSDHMIYWYILDSETFLNQWTGVELTQVTVVLTCNLTWHILRLDLEVNDFWLDLLMLTSSVVRVT